ncbi:MAG: hypothetical protein A07HN63_00900 [uncultured archaeon A07HN63]|nr:MAG: hypothetical protein A07HN63_00900 [uncultured archaeon A07HN63]
MATLSTRPGIRSLLSWFFKNSVELEPPRKPPAPFSPTRVGGSATCSWAGVKGASRSGKTADASTAVSGANEKRSERVVDRRETTVARPERLGAFELFVV